MKFIGRFFAIVVDLVLIFFIVFAFAIRTSPVQTYLAQKATAFLSDELKTKMHIEEVAFVFFDRLALKGVYVEDQQGEVLGDIKTLHVRLDALDLANNKITIAAVELEEGDVHIQRDSLTGDYNYWFIQDYFDTGPSTTKKEPIGLAIKTIRLTDVHFRYDDNRKSYSTYGMDWDHLDFENVNLLADNIAINGNDVSCDVKNLSTKEKSGFMLDKLSTKAVIIQKGIYLDDLKIKTPFSNVSFDKMNLKMNQLPDVYTFEDSVTFDAKILPSRVSLKDVSYFASALEGMDQIVNLSGHVTRKVKDLRVSQMDLRTGKKTVVKGTINLPDFRNIRSSFFSEKLDYAYVDLNDVKRIKLPNDNGGGYMSFDPMVERLGHFEGENVKLDGFQDQFVIAANRVSTDLGSIRMDNGILFAKNEANDSYNFSKSQASDYDVKVENFQLGKLLNNNDLGIVDGTFFFSGEAKYFDKAIPAPFLDVQFSELAGNVNQFDYLGYAYKNITVTDGSLLDEVLIAKVEVNDDNLNLTYDGTIDFKGQQKMDFTLDLTKAMLDNLGFTNVDSKVHSFFKVNLTGTNENNLSGDVQLVGFVYTEGGKQFDVPDMTIGVERGEFSDHLSIDSKLGTAKIDGKIDFTQIGNSLQNQLSQILPALFDPPKKRSGHVAKNNNFTYNIRVEDMDEFLNVFVPGLHIEKNTTISGQYAEITDDFEMNLKSSLITYEGYKFTGIQLNQRVDNEDLRASLTIDQFHLNDSITVDQVLFNSSGTRDTFISDLSWNPDDADSSRLNWTTSVINDEALDFLIHPSHITIQQKQWDIKKPSSIQYRKDYISIQDFLFERQDQFISLDGLVSDRDEDKLTVKIRHLQLDDFAPILQSSVDLKGELNGFGKISTPFTNISFTGDASIKDLFIDNEEIGDLYVQSNWEKGAESIGLNGDLNYKKHKTFAFEGLYHLDRKKDILDFNLVFDKTDIQFTNAFMDPQVISDIAGTLTGEIQVKGTPESPQLSGAVDLDGGTAKVGILGVKFKTSGEIYCDEYGFYMDNLPIYDEENNAGSLVGSIYHDNFVDWNFDLSFNLEDDAVNKDPIVPWKVLPLDRFLVMNTEYKEGDYYYGKAYMTGYANIFGYTDHLEITVDAETQKGTAINFPMYGASEISNEESFIRFTPADSSITLLAPELDFTGVDLNLNFDVTPDAKLKIIFDENIGDEISADGTGRMSMKVDNLGDISLDGTYTVNQGVYNFAMGPVKQNFFIEEGGAITWTGDPYNANLDIRSFYKVKASLSEISVDQLGNAGNTNQEVFCYLDITETLLTPAIAFDIDAPRADESGKALINRIKSDPEELNRQFFSLLLWKRFQPLKGSTNAAGGAAFDLATNQINSMLSQLSQSYKLAVNLDADATGDKTYEVGLSKEFLDNRLILSGSFGLESQSQSTNTQGQNFLIGDVNLEYLLNEEGTFRVNVFNESNQNNVIQDNNQGLFKQGVGLHYQEDFTGGRNFKLVQYFLDLFRKSDNKRFPEKRKKQQTPVPKEPTAMLVAILNEEW